MLAACAVDLRHTWTANFAPSRTSLASQHNSWQEEAWYQCFQLCLLMTEKGVRIPVRGGCGVKCKVMKLPAAALPAPLSAGLVLVLGQVDKLIGAPAQQVQSCLHSLLAGASPQLPDLTI